MADVTNHGLGSSKGASEMGHMFHIYSLEASLAPSNTVSGPV